MGQPINASQHAANRLSGFVDAPAMRAAAAAIRREVECLTGLSHALDCTAVTGFSGPALAELAQLIRDVRRAGSRVRLVNLDGRVNAAIPERLIEDLLLPTIEKYVTPVPGWTADRLRPSVN